MDQKRAMLYPEFDVNDTRSQEQRNTASAAMGLPVQAPPPSYDIAIGCAPSAPVAVSVAQIATTPMADLRGASAAGLYFEQAPMPVIVEQPGSITTTTTTTRATTATRLPQQYPQQQQQQQQTHMNLTTEQAATTVGSAAKLGPNPCNVRCPACGAQKTTRMIYTPNTRTHFCALLLCLVGWCCCACCVPYCMNSCRTGNHYCVKCNTFLGAYQPRGLK